MEITRLAELRPRFVWDVVDDAFDMYREKFALFCGIAACVAVPIGIITIAYTATGLSKMAAASKSDPFAALGFLGPLLFITLPLALAANILQTGATAIAVEAQLNGQTLTFGDAYKQALTRIWPLLGAMVMVALLVIVGGCAAGIGAIFAIIYLNFVAQAVVLENRSVWSAIKRSKQLAENNMGKVFGLIMLIGFLTSLLSYGIQGIVELIFLLIPTGGAQTAQTVQKTLVSQSATGLVGIFLAPVGFIATTLLYYDLRVRREGLDIAVAAQETGVTLAPDPFGDAPSTQVSRQMAKDRQRLR